jgi:hypothetical protein
MELAPHLPPLGTVSRDGYFFEGLKHFNQYTVKRAVEFLDAPSKNTLLKWNKYNSIVEIVYLDTHVFFPHSVIK